MAGCDPRHRLGPFQRGALTIGVVGTFPPGVKRVQTLLVLPDRAQILPMHVQAVGASVELRRSQLGQRDERSLEPGLLDVAIERVHGLVDPWCNPGIVDTWFHDITSRLLGVERPRRRTRAPARSRRENPPER